MSDEQKQFEISFQPSGRGKAQCPPNPAYPNGVEVDGHNPQKASCKALLPYPASECGLWLIRCRICGNSVAVTAAGRPDDPISAKFNCQPIPNPMVQ